MSPLPKDILHIFVTLVILFFTVVCILAASGKYDHWTTRFISRFKRVRFRKRRNEPNDKTP